MALRFGAEPTIAFVAMAAVVLPTLCGAPLHARDVDRWLELRSRHFTVVSNTGEEETRRVALEFERVRAMLLRALTNARVDPRQPVVVLAVNDEDSLRELLPQYWERKGQRPVAAYWGGPHGHCIVLRMNAPEHERHRRVLHEYVHLLTHANVPDLPAWLDEGLSEFWGTAVVQDDAVEVGRSAPHNLKVFQAQRSWIPLDELLAMERAPDARDKQRLSLFYAQSWALVHHLMLGGSSTNLELAPSRDLGNLSQLKADLGQYVRGGRFRAVRIELPQPEAESPDRDEDLGLRVRALAPAQSLAIRAGCLVDGERPVAALPLLTRALATDPNEASVLETLGSFHFQQNNPLGAAQWFDRAIATGSASHLAYFYRAILAGPVPDQVLGGQPVRADEYLRRAIDLDPGFAPAYVRLAALYTRQADRLEAALPLMRRATELEPENAAYWVEFGKLLVSLDRPGEALEARQRALASARSTGSRRLVEAFLRNLDQGSLARQDSGRFSLDVVQGIW